MYSSNAVLAGLTIINARRSNQIVDLIPINVKASTPNEKIQQIQVRLTEMVEKHGGDFEKKVGVTPQTVLDMESVSLNVSYKQKSNNQVLLRMI